MRFLLLYVFLVVSKFLGAQQNFINVPSSEVTKKGKLFVQEQLNYSNLLQSNSTIDYGLGRGTEIGINLIGINYHNNQGKIEFNDSNQSTPYCPLFLINLIKTRRINKSFYMSLGAQLGTNLDRAKSYSTANLFYFNVSYKDLFIKKSNIVMGTYYNSLHYGGKGNRWGYWIGMELPLYKQFSFIAEYIFGTNALSYTSLALMYSFHQTLMVTLGTQLSSTQQKSNSLVLELTYVPK